MKKKIGDLTVREIIQLKCCGDKPCSKCPFADNDNYILDKLCALVGEDIDSKDLDQEIEVEDNE